MKKKQNTPTKDLGDDFPKKDSSKPSLSRRGPQDKSLKVAPNHSGDTSSTQRPEPPPINQKNITQPLSHPDHQTQIPISENSSFTLPLEVDEDTQAYPEDPSLNEERAIPPELVSTSHDFPIESEKSSDDTIQLYPLNDKSNKPNQITTLIDNKSDDSLTNNNENNKTEQGEATVHIHKTSHTQDMTVRLSHTPTQIGSLPINLGSDLDINLIQSQNIRVAQEKIIDLENEIESLRLDNNQLTLSGRTLKRKNEELTSQLEEIQKTTRGKLEQAEKEAEMISKFVKEKDNKIKQLLTEKDQLESHLKMNFRKIRVREKELENRLELVRMEHIAINNSKDEVVLNLKRKVDQLSLDLDNFRSKIQELNDQLNEKKEALQRTVKALRLALVMLENEGSSQQSG